MALINGIEGSQNALTWLQTHGYSTLYKMALIGDGDENTFEEMKRNDLKVYAMLAKKMQQVKDEIEEQNNDIHRISKS